MKNSKRALTAIIFLTVIILSVLICTLKMPGRKQAEDEINSATSVPTEAPFTAEPTFTAEPALTPEVTFTAEPTATPNPTSTPTIKKALENGQKITVNPDWEFASFSEIKSGYAVLYKATGNRKDIIIGVNAGHGTKGGTSVKTYCHPDKTAKTTSGSTAAGSIKAIAVSGGMEFPDGTSEGTVTLAEAKILCNLLLDEGYDVLLLRSEADVQLDNIARTVISNNIADCHISLHWDGDGLNYDKGCFYCSVPDGIKNMYPVSKTWQKSNALGDCLINGLKNQGNKIFKSGKADQDLTQTSFSTVPSVNIELGNQSSPHDDVTLLKLAKGLTDGISEYFGKR